MRKKPFFRNLHDLYGKKTFAFIGKKTILSKFVFLWQKNIFSKFFVLFIYQKKSWLVQFDFGFFRQRNWPKLVPPLTSARLAISFDHMHPVLVFSTFVPVVVFLYYLSFQILKLSLSHFHLFSKHDRTKGWKSIVFKSKDESIFCTKSKELSTVDIKKQPKTKTKSKD